MSKAKTKVTPELIKNFVKTHGYSDATFGPIEGGELSQAYYFNTTNGDKVLRINSTDEGFLKDKYAAEHFASSNVPVPKIEKIGKLAEDKYFAISKRADGKTLVQFSKEEVNKLMPQIITMVEAIHATPPITDGYGWIRLNGQGKFSSWHEALDEMQAAEDDHKLAEVSFFEQDYYDALRTEILTYYKYCPEARQLIHGDLSGNTLSDGSAITGIIDWHSAMYGDPLWDVAWLDFWGEWQSYAGAFRQHYNDQGRLPDNFNKRLTCYKMIAGANSMAFFAKSDQPEKYNYSKKILAAIRKGTVDNRG